MATRIMDDVEHARTFTRWWIENYMGWGQFRSPPTFPYPVEAETMAEKCNTMNRRLGEA